MKFTDKSGKAWDISLTIGSIKRVKSNIGVDLLDIEGGEEPLISRLLLDEVLLAEVIAELISDQLGDMSQAEMLDRFDGETLAAASKAFWEEMKGFFTSKSRQDRLAVILKATSLLETAISQGAQRVSEIEIDAE